MILLWMHQSPFTDIRGQELTDLLLTYAAFEQPLSLLFSDSAVLSLLPPNNDASAGIKTYNRQFKALPMYDIDRIYVDQQSFVQYGLVDQTLLCQVQPLSPTAMASLITEAQFVIRGH